MDIVGKMIKTEIISKLRQLNFNINEYIVIAGAALVLHGVKDRTADIDLSCTSKMFNELISRGKNFKINYLGYRYISFDIDIEIFEEYGVYNINFIDGIPTADLQSIRKMKMELGRDKDLEDIKLIDKLLGNGIT